MFKMINFYGLCKHYSRWYRHMQSCVNILFVVPHIQLAITFSQFGKLLELTVKIQRINPLALLSFFQLQLQIIIKRMQYSFIILILICGILFVNGKRYNITATGQVLCSVSGTSYPVEFTKVNLKDKDTIGSTCTNSLGYFTMSGTADDLFGEPKLYTEVVYEYSGIYRQMEVQKELFGIKRREHTSIKSYSSRIDFGNVTFSSDHCRAYVMAYQVMKDYRMRTGKPLPYSRLKVVTRAPINGGDSLLNNW